MCYAWYQHHYVLMLCVLLHSLKSDVLSSLPAKTREFVTVSLTQAAVSEFTTLQADEAQLRQQQQAASSADEANVIGNRIRGVQNKMYSVTGDGKLVSASATLTSFCYFASSTIVNSLANM